MVELKKPAHAATILLSRFTITSSSSMLFGSAPHELLRAIFLRTFAPSFLLNPDIAHGPRSAWCQSTRDKKSIVLVCQSWCAVGTEFLYDDVVLRRIGQVPALIRSLEENAGLVAVIKSLSVRCFVPPAYESMLCRDIELIMRLCVNVKKITIFTSFGHKPSHRHFPNGFLERKDIFATHLTDYNMPFIQTRVSADILNTLVNLRELCVAECIFAVPHHDGTLHFPVLESLSITGHDEADSQPSLICPPWEWSMPAIRNVTLVGVVRVYDFETGYLESFLMAHGASLKYLDVSCPPKGLQALMDLCPKLEHLVASVDWFHPSDYESYPKLSHRMLKYLDLRYFISNDPPPALLQLMDSYPENLKSLVGIRSIDSPLGESFLPQIFTPPVTKSSASFQPLEFNFPGVHVRCGEHQII